MTRRPAFLPVFVLTLGILLVLSALWNLASPLGSGADEPAHAVRAAMVVRGELLRPGVPHMEGVYTTARVPTWVDSLFAQPRCYQFDSRRPAGCAPPLARSAATVTSETYVGRYPPLYYLVAGLPSLVASGPVAMRLMRLAGSVPCDLLLALAVAGAAAWSRSGLLPAALACATTPMTTSLTGVINPSALEISAAIAVWTLAAVAVVDHDGSPPRALGVGLWLSAAVLVLTRGDSPIWIGVFAACLLPLSPGLRAARALARRRAARVGVALLAAVLAVAAAWTLHAHSLRVFVASGPITHASRLTLLHDAVGRVGPLVEEQVGVFGWLDTPAPAVTYLAWGAATAALIGAVVQSSDRPLRRSLAVTAGAALALPVLSIVATARTAGVAAAQGRYYLPLTVGVVIVAGCLRDEGRRPVRTGRYVISLVTTASVVSFWWALHRYTVGGAGPLAPWEHVAGGWRPPLGAVPIDLAFLLVSLAAWAGLLRLTTVHRRIGVGSAGPPATEA